MVNLRTFQRQAVAMGQTSSQAGPKSSQLGPSAPMEPAESQDASLQNAKGRNHRKKTGKRKSAEIAEDDGDEEGTARALMQLSADAVLNARPSFYDDDAAASAQLMAESSPPRPLVRYGVGGYLEDQEEHGRDKKAKRKRRRRGNSEVLHNSAKAFDKEEGRSRKARHKRNGLDHTGTSPSDLPRSTFSLDDIDSNDEFVASYLQEYESGVASRPSSTVPQIGVVQSQFPGQQVAVEIGSEPIDNAMYSIYRTPSPTYNPNVNGKDNRKRKHHADLLARDGKNEVQEPLNGISKLSTDPHNSSVHPEKHKRKRKKATDSALDNGYDEHQGLLNGTGQHVFDHDLEAFDQYMIENGMHSANLLDHDPGHTMPIDPQLIRESGLVERAEDGALLGSGGDITRQTSGNGKLKRVSSFFKKPRASTTRASSRSPPYVSPYAIKGDQHDGESPGMHDSQRQPSPELGFDRSVNIDDARRSSAVIRSRPKKSTSKLEKRTKPLGADTGHNERRRNNENASIEEIANKGGMFTTAEVAQLDAFRQTYCEENEISTWQFNELIHAPIRGNPKVTKLFIDINEILPYRKPTSLQRFCRRRYHNFSARGTWTKEEDERLKQAIAEKGKSWKAVGQVIERLPEDCRDRWRNYLINADNRNTERWTGDEIKNLVMAVHDCMKVMRYARRAEKERKYAGRDVPDSEPDTNDEAEEMKLINWQAVSDRMGENGGGRSRLQCSHKYSKLKLADRSAYMRQVRQAGERMKRLEEGRPEKKSSKSREGWRYKSAKKRVANMKVGDKYDLLQVLSTCRVSEEGNIPWKRLGNNDFRAKWSRLERQAAWEMIKTKVPGSEKMDYHDVVNRLLTKMMAEDVEHFDERWDPEKDGNINDEGNFKKLSRRQERRNENKRKLRARRKSEREAGAVDPNGLQNREKLVNGVEPKSALFVSSSDEEDRAMDGASHDHSEAAGTGDEYEIHDTSKLPTAPGTEDEQQGSGESDSSEDGEQEEEVQTDGVGGESDEEHGFDVSDDLGDRLQLLRDA